MGEKFKKYGMLRAALSYARQGFRVIPLHTAINGECSCGEPECTHIAKHPHYDSKLMPHGVKNATTDRKTIRRWWKKWPDANIGLATGEIGVIAIDVDLPHGPANLKIIEEKYGKLPKTVTNKTGGGGYQLLFKPISEPVKSSTGILAENIDVRGEAGYIVVPSSMHESGIRYEWEKGYSLKERAPAEIPKLLVDLINEGEVYCEHIHLKEPIIKGTRNDRLIKIAGYLRSIGHEEDEILNSLELANENRCKPPLKNKDLRKIAKKYQVSITLSGSRQLSCPVFSLRNDLRTNGFGSF